MSLCVGFEPCNQLTHVSGSAAYTTSLRVRSFLGHCDRGMPRAPGCLFFFLLSKIDNTGMSLQDGMLKLMQSLSTESQELKLDVSSCGLTPDCIVRLNAEVSIFNSIVELDLGGNQLKQEVWFTLLLFITSVPCLCALLGK